MTLRARLVITSLALAVFVALVFFEVTNVTRAHEMTATLDRLVRQQTDEASRQRCEMDPASFPGGSGRPPAPPVNPNDPNDVPPPRRAQLEHRAFELFPYDDDLRGQNVNAPRFPEELRRVVFMPSQVLTGSFSGDGGTGVQMALVTGWNGPCAVFFARMQPLPGQHSTQAVLFLMFLVATFGVAITAGISTVRRIANLTAAVRRSAHQEYGEVVTVSGHDEISSLAFAFNEAGGDIRRRIVDVREREDALKRFVASTTDDVELPLTALQVHLNDLAGDASMAPSSREHVQASVTETHDIRSLLRNLGTTARLRSAEATVRVPVEMNALVDRVMASHEALARSAQVTINAALPDRPVVASGDVAFFETAVNNLVDNAIQYNRPGGHLNITLARIDQGQRFSLRVTDDGPGVATEDIKRLAIRRFRTDEARRRKPRGLGLGLEIVRDVAAKFDLQIAFRQPPAGGFEAELSGTA